MEDAKEVRITVADARQQFSQLLARAAYAGQRVIICRYGKPIAAIVPMRDLGKLRSSDPSSGPDILAEIDRVMSRWTGAAG